MEEDIEVRGQPPQRAVPRHGGQLLATCCGLGEGCAHDALTDRIHIDFNGSALIGGDQVLLKARSGTPMPAPEAVKASARMR